MTKHKLLLSHMFGQFRLADLDLVIFSLKEVGLSISSQKMLLSEKMQLLVNGLRQFFAEKYIARVVKNSKQNALWVKSQI